MIGTCRIARRRTNAAIFFTDKIGMRQFFIAPKSPRDPRLLMQIFGKRFREPIRQRFAKNGAVIIVLFLELFGQLICSVNRNRESAQVIL